MILSVKEAIKLDKKTIEERFNLKEDYSNGVNKQFFGTNFGKLKGIKNLFMMTFLYTFKDSVMLGVGVNLEDLTKNKLNINEILDEVKKHPAIAPYIKNGETIEYSAHLIPEGGYRKMPKLVTSGAILVGDSAGFVNGVHFEGTNFALISGKLAGETAIVALNNTNRKENALYALFANHNTFFFFLRYQKNHQLQASLVNTNMDRFSYLAHITKGKKIALV